MQTGRPTIYSQELVGTICGRLAEGETLRAICRDPAMPVLSTVMRWLNEPDKQSFKDQYAEARIAQAGHLFDELKEIADDASGDVNRDRLRVDTRKWYLSKLAPKVYGDRLDLTSGGEKLTVQVINYAGYPSAQVRPEDVPGPADTGP